MNSRQPWIQWIDSAVIHDLYANGIQKYGGLGSPSKDGCVDGALGAAYTAELYSMPEVDEETAVSGITFCGYLLFYLATKHCFTDGNKRVSWSSAMWVLGVMGLTVNVSDAEAIQFCLDIADGTIEKGEDVVNWFAEHLAEVDP